MGKGRGKSDNVKKLRNPTTPRSILFQESAGENGEEIRWEEKTTDL